jgi:hypothetical protein
MAKVSVTKFYEYYLRAFSPMSIFLFENTQNLIFLLELSLREKIEKKGPQMK